jgi:hypothetical protein
MTEAGIYMFLNFFSIDFLLCESVRFFFPLRVFLTDAHYMYGL